jgi:peptidyl-tRNA hydrolase, PTH1 family
VWLVVGLGNPGPKYLRTRHNIGFMCVDILAGDAPFKSEHKAQVARLMIGGEKTVLAKPQTYMNLSGESVQPLMHFYKITPENLIVLHDEADLPYTHMRIQKNRSAGGHNGLKSINQVLATQDYYRIRLGVGRPTTPMDTADYLLQNFNSEEMTSLPEFLEKGLAATEMLITKGLGPAASQFNKSPGEKPEEKVK